MSEIENAAQDKTADPCGKRKRSKEHITFLLSIIDDIRKKHKYTEIPRNSDDSFAICRARGEINRLTNWRDYKVKPYTEKPASKKKERVSKAYITPEMGEQITALRKRGQSYTEISAQVGVSYKLVNNYCCKHGLQGERIRKINDELAARMYEEGKSIAEIAKHFNASWGGARQAIRRWRRQWDI